MTALTPPRHAPPWLRSAVERLEADQRLDRVDGKLAPLAANIADGDRGAVLRGQWLGHALHPLLTDLPLGCWLSAALLDLVGGRRSRRAAQRLVGLGLIAVPPTAAAGFADWSPVSSVAARRVGVVHAVGNIAMTLLYLGSWRARRRGHHLRGVGFGLMGGTLGWITGYLGGHLSFNLAVGVEDRGLRDSSRSDLATQTQHEGDTLTDADEIIGVSEAARLLTVPSDRLRTMVDEGLLMPAAGNQDDLRFKRGDVLALRLQGG